MINILVGNLKPETTQDELRCTFAAYGTVERVNIVLEGGSGKSRGFAFIQMADRLAAEAAIEQLDGAELNGQPMNVS